MYVAGGHHQCVPAKCEPPLPFDAHSSVALDATLDEVRERFGSKAITRAVLLGRDEGLAVPLLPDCGRVTDVSRSV